MLKWSCRARHSFFRIIVIGSNGFSFKKKKDFFFQNQTKGINLHGCICVGNCNICLWRHYEFTTCKHEIKVFVAQER